MNSSRSRVVLERIVWASFFFLIVLVFDWSIEVQFTLPKLLILRAVSPLLLLLWVARFRNGGLRPLPMVILASLCALVGWWILSTVFSVDPVTALQGMHGRYNGLLNQAILALIFLMVASTAASRKGIEWLLELLVFALVPASIYAIVQNMGFDWLVWPNPRPASTIGHPVPLAAMLALATPFVLAFLLTETRTARRLLWAAILLLFLAASASTLSRGPWAGLTVAMGVVLVSAFRQRLVELKRSWIRDGDIGFAVVVLLAVVGLGWPSAAVSRFTGRLTALAHLETDPSFMNRFVYFAAANRMLRDHPIVGVGFETYGLLYPRYRPVEGEAVPSDELPTMAHNGYLQMAVTNGVPGLMLYLALVMAIVLVVWRASRQSAARAPDATTTRDTMIGMAFIGAIAGYMVQDLSGWLELPLSIYFWTLLGAAVSFSTAASPPRPWFPVPVWRAAGTVAGVLGAAAIAVLAVATFRELRADGLFFEAKFLDVSRDWPRIEENIAAGLRLAADDPYYTDAAGALNLKRLAQSFQRPPYDQAVAFFERAAQKNAFDPYILIHRIDTETLALRQKVVATPTDSAKRAIALVVDMDPNNATVHESVARLSFVEGSTGEALTSIRRAEALRPSHSRYHMLEGDALRLLGDRDGAVAAYRKEVATLTSPDDPDWVLVENRLIVTLLETGQHEAAAGEAKAVVARAPGDAAAHTLLGVAYLELKAPEMAQASFARALEIDPAGSGARQGLAEAERQLAPADRPGERKK